VNIWRGCSKAGAHFLAGLLPLSGEYLNWSKHSLLGAMALELADVIKSRITVLIGEFGSGKTELAANLALGLARGGKPTAVVDLDIVKPYFRTRENRATLERCGLTVVAPENRLANADLPIMPDNLPRVLGDEKFFVVIDVGGGEGAIVLGRLRKELAKAQVLMVVNTYRPFTSSVQDILAAERRLSESSRLKIAGFISNSNLGPATEEHHIREGFRILEAASAVSGLPVLFVAVPPWIGNPIAGISCPVLTIQIHTRYPWMERD